MKTKDQVQKEAVSIMQKYPRGIILAATGVGKSKIAIDYILSYHGFLKENQETNKFLIVVPTEKLRDNNWKEEFEKWDNHFDVYNKNVEMVCYASINKIKNKVYNTVIFDEVHNITENNSKFFENNYCHRVYGLTATFPKNLEKKKLIDRYFLSGGKYIPNNIIYEVTLDDAVKWGLVAPYEINVVLCDLDTESKVVKAGNKLKPFMQTEKAAYNYATKRILDFIEQRTDYPESMWSEADRKTINFMRINRKKLLANSFTKANVTSFLLKRIIPKDERTIIFCGNTEQADMLCAYRFHSKVKDENYEKFVNKEINQISCVGKLNEGLNVPDVDNAVITQIDSNELDLVQRIGRIIRLRENHTGKIWVVVVKNSIDLQWFEKASANFDKRRIHFIDFELLRETI